VSSDLFTSKENTLTRIAIAGFLHETNTFSPIPTTLNDFNNHSGPYAGYLDKEQLLGYRLKTVNRAVCGFVNQAAQLGFEIVPIIWAAAEPANQVITAAFEYIMGLIENGLTSAGPFDGVYLDLHGAMVFENYRAGETEILKRIRAILGDVPIVASLDLHGNISEETFELASALVGYRTYPHVDIYDTGIRSAQLLDRLLQGVEMRKSFQRVPFLMPITTQSTHREPCRSIYAGLGEIEKDLHLFSTTIMAGFPLADMPNTGPSIFAYAPTQGAADKAVDWLLQSIEARAAEFIPDLLSPDEAVEKSIQIARSQTRPVILADVQDNAGAGGTSDTPGLLEALVRCHAPRSALGLIFDPAVAQMAFEAGEGADIFTGLGGKLVPGQEPFFATFRVKRLFEGDFLPTGPMFKGISTNLGKMANLQVDDIQVVVVSRRTQANDQSYFRQVDIEPQDLQILALKSSNHYRADFEQISCAILQVAAPGAIIEDPGRIAYRNVHLGSVYSKSTAGSAHT